MSILKMENMTWKEVKEINKYKSVIIVALSPIEEHGPHLSLGTDYILAKDLLSEVVNELEEENDEFNYIIHPPFPLGYNECVMNYPGTISYKAKTIENLIIDFGESVKRSGFSKIILINHHLDLGHIKAIENAREVLTKKFEVEILEVASCIIYCENPNRHSKAAEGIGLENEIHADFRETSLMLYKHPELVKDFYDKLKPVYMNLKKFIKSGKRYWSEWGIEEGYVGSPSKSSKESGEKMFNDSVKNITHLILEFLENSNTPQLSENIKNAMMHMILR